ncbi:hypothetical protein P167DRAFT_214865 [Morchella conica CCBAS932]|uniref:TLC domain-containing protein n=1 Tax=Morchella conica CCBAS932 TaxID=1392247 RepID=A0A3N4KLN4_9PEZI|nr:hypothetical protein P167DRAFT_214865 [Morchella conica CCBAS932]
MSFCMSFFLFYLFLLSSVLFCSGPVLRAWDGNRCFCFYLHLFFYFLLSILFFFFSNNFTFTLLYLLHASYHIQSLYRHILVSVFCNYPSLLLFFFLFFFFFFLFFFYHHILASVCFFPFFLGEGGDNFLYIPLFFSNLLHVRYLVCPILCMIFFFFSF